MSERMRRRSEKIGLPPGSYVYMGEKKAEKVKISLIDYSETHFEKRTVERIEEIFPYKDRSGITWINIDGLHDVSILEGIATHFGIHPLVIEDILSINQRPKIEVNEEYIFVIVKMLRFEDEEIDVEQISVLFGKNFVITFQEAEGDIFTPVRNRIESGKGRIRKSGADYLAYALLDVIVDHYFLILEKLGEEIELLEEEVLEKPAQPLVGHLHRLRRELIDVRRSTWPLREVISNLQRSESPLIKKATSRFISDLYDHTIQVIDMVESYREMAASILEVYLSMISHRMNEVMKVLTMIATIFIPLSFLAGVYGMNFDTSVSPFNMPELSTRYGYIVFWIVSILTGGGLLFLFKRKEWL